MSEPVNLLDPQVRANPYPTYARMHAEGPIHKIEPGDMWAVTGAAEVEYVLKNPKLFTSGMGLIYKPAWLPHNPIGDSMVVMDDPEHGQLRGLVSKAFTPRALARLEPRIRALCVEVAEHVAAVGEGDFIEALCMRLPGLVILEILALDRKHLPDLSRWVSHLVMVTPVYPGDELANAIRTSLREMEGYVREAIAARRRTPGEGTLSELIAAEIDGRKLTDEEIVAFMFLLLPAGFETTMHFFSHVLLDFDRRPEAFTRLREDPSLIPAYVEEILRLDPPATSIFRMTTTETELGGVRLPSGTMLMMALGVANRDPARFADPDRCDPVRGSQGSLTFGHGMHFCLGAALARLEGRLMLEELATRFVRFEKLPGEIQWNQTIHVRGPVALPFRAIRKT